MEARIAKYLLRDPPATIIAQEDSGITPIPEECSKQASTATMDERRWQESNRAT